MSDVFKFRAAGPSDRGENRKRYYVNLAGHCIGSVEGCDGSWTLDRSQRDRDYPTRLAAATELHRGPRPISDEQKVALEERIKRFLHAGRDCMRNRQDTDLDYNPADVGFNIRSAYYGEAWGIAHAVVALGWGFYGAVNHNDFAGCAINVSVWMGKLEREVLAEENFGGSNKCDICVERYGKDGAGRTRESIKINTNTTTSADVGGLAG